jgi:spermidine synthase
LAFCSIVYELLLGQSLSAFLGNTVLRYSVTIGLYMLSMGIGSLLAEGRMVKHVVTTLLKVEILLTITGGFSVIFLLVMDSIAPPDIVFFLFAHLLIILIGILTGLEIPLLIELRNLEADGSERSVLGVDYLGAFAGTVVFAFLFYPIVGLIPTAFLVALLNALVGVFLVTQWRKVHEDQRQTTRSLLGVQVALFAVLALLLRSAEDVNELFLNVYLGL